MEIVVYEDKKSDKDALCSFIDKFFKEMSCPVEITAYDNGQHFLNGLSEDVKIAFLDIYMPGISGIDVARKIRERDKDMVIIFTTTSIDHGLDAYSVEALQYLVKPVGYSDVESALKKCMDRFGDSLRFIEVLANRLNVRVLLKDIRFIEVFKNTCLIHTTAETIKSYCSLEKIERQIDGQMFLRTHRSFIVNMRYIEDVTEDGFLLKDSVVVPISRSDKLEVKQAHRDWLFALSRGGGE